MTKISNKIYLSLIYLFFYLPVAIIIIFSFNSAKRTLIWHGFSFKWYAQLFHDSRLLTVTMHSLTIATLAATIAGFLGLLTAVSLFRYKFNGKKFIHGLIFVMILMPDIVMGISLLLLYSVMHLPLGFWSLLFAHITFCIPFVAVTIYSRIVTLDKSVFEAARDLGAGDFTIFGKILFPLLLPAIAAGWLLSFTMSLDDVIVSYFVAGPNFEILPLKIFAMVRLGINPEVNALCTILLAATLIIVVASQKFLTKKKSI